MGHASIVSTQTFQLGSHVVVLEKPLVRHFRISTYYLFFGGQWDKDPFLGRIVVGCHPYQRKIH